MANYQNPVVKIGTGKLGNFEYDIIAPAPKQKLSPDKKSELLARLDFLFEKARSERNGQES